MLLDNPLEHIFVATVIPDAIGPDHSDRPGGADLQAIGFGPGNPAFAV